MICLFVHNRLNEVKALCALKSSSGHFIQTGDFDPFHTQVRQRSKCGFSWKDNLFIFRFIVADSSGWDANLDGKEWR